MFRSDESTIIKGLKTERKSYNLYSALIILTTVWLGNKGVVNRKGVSVEQTRHLAHPSSVLSIFFPFFLAEHLSEFPII